MVMKKLVLPKNRILGLSIVIICVFSLFSFFFLDVNAKTKEEKLAQCGEAHNVSLINLYGVTVHKKKSDLKYEIRMDINNSDANIRSKLGSTVFKITKINDKDVTSKGWTIKPGGDEVIKITKGDFEKNEKTGEKKVRIEMESTKTLTIPELCKGKIKIIINYIKGGDAKTTYDVVPKIDEADYTGINTGEIDCDNPNKYSLGSFENLFCESKNGAKANRKDNSDKKNSVVYNNKFGQNLKYKDLSEDPITFKCDYKTIHKAEDLTGDNYYVNRKYVYGSGSYTMKFGSYQYHYSPDQEPVKKGEVSCKIKCEEGVTVEYGPPVASKAGLCFEYKVKVTSRVNCYMDKKPALPEVPTEVCTPTPICTNTAHTYELNVGGPNNSFDSCIKQCDGGKYSDSCSQKCYNYVYGKSGVLPTNNSFIASSIQKLAKKKKTEIKVENKKGYGVAEPGEFSMSACKAINPNGCYTFSGDAIIWDPGNTPGRWYGGGCPAEYNIFEEGNGICRHDYGNDHCHDICWWTGCGDNQYLNPGFAAKDREKNKELYDWAVTQCKAAASCTSTTATFAISVNYKHNVKEGGTVKEKTEKIYFPYSTEADRSNKNNKDKISSLGEESEKLNTNKSNPDDTTILNYDGCYKNSNQKKWYMTEWSFPGTWIENKTGNISYIKKTGTDWQNMNKKFCIPLDALNVNTRWWNYYYYNINKGKNENNDSTKNPSYNAICGNNIDSITNPQNIGPDSDGWNIHAKTRKFGFYAWNINIDCFYALNSNPANVSTSDDKSKQDKCIINDQKGSNDYKIRPVDLTNLFPATDGGDSNLTDPKSTGRTPGFNWSQYANTGNKNLSYASKPSEYVETVQRLGYKVYNDENLDYQFILTRDILNDMKTTTKVNGKNYTEFNGKTEVKNGVVHYISSAIRSGSELSKADKKVPEKSNIFCNNMKNYSQGCR